jgi:hypothetical protein
LGHNGRNKWRSVSKSDEKGAEQSDQVLSFGRSEGLDARALSLKKGGECVVGEVVPLFCKAYEHPSPVPWVGLALNKAECLETIESDGHAPRGQQQSLRQLGWS